MTHTTTLSLRQRTAFKYAFIAAALATGMANAATYTVTDGADSGAGSLRDIISLANAGDTITFASGVTTVLLDAKKDNSGAYLPSNTANNPLTINKNLTIDGDTNDDGVPDVTISGQWHTQVLKVDSGVTATLDGVKLIRGALAGNGGIGGNGGDALGAGIHNSGNLTLHNSVVAQHVAGAGGASNSTASGGGGFAGGTANYTAAAGQFAGNSNSSNIDGRSVGGNGHSGSLSGGNSGGVDFGGGSGGVGDIFGMPGFFLGGGGGGGFGSGGGGGRGLNTNSINSINGQPGASAGATAAPNSDGGDGGHNGNGQYDTSENSGGGGHQQIIDTVNNSWAASGGGGAGANSSALGGNAAGGIYNASGATLMLSGSTDIKQNIGAGGGGSQTNGGRGIGGVWNDGTLRYSTDAQANLIAGGNLDASGGGATIPSGSTDGVYSAPSAITTTLFVSNVTATTADDTYRVGDTIDITVQFSAAVDVNTSGGTPTLTLETGATDRTATYSSGSGTNTLTFRYTVQAGDESTDLAYLNPNALTLNGGTINEHVAGGGSGGPGSPGTGFVSADLTLPTVGGSGSLSANKDIVIDGVVPIYAGRSSPLSPSTDTTLIVRFNEDVQLGTGNIVIVNTNDANDTRTFDVANSSSPISVNGRTVTITPSPRLLHSTDYYVTIANTAITDSAGNAYAGVSNQMLAFSTINIAPSSQDSSITPAEDSSHYFQAGDFPFIDEGNDSLASVTLLRQPEAGELTLNGIAVNNGQSIVAADIGNLAYTPPINFNGSEALRFQVVDQSGDSSGYPENTLTINVTPANDDITFDAPMRSGKAMLDNIYGNKPLAVDAQGNAYVSYVQFGATQLSKLTANGQLDTHFGNQGSVDLSPANNFSSMVLAADGSLYLSEVQNSWLGNADFTVHKLQADGTPDTTFGTNGQINIDIDSSSYDLAMRLVLSGSDLFILGSSGSFSRSVAVVKVNAATGQTVNTFGSNNNGIFTFTHSGFDLDQFGGLTIAADGTLWLSGRAADTTNYDPGLAVIKVSAGGVVDSSFGTGGLAYFGGSSNSYDVGAQSVVIGNGGEILVAGTHKVSNGQTDFALVKLDANGSLVQSFGTNGFSYAGLNNATAMRIQQTAGGEILFSGHVADSNRNYTIALAKFKQDGTLDTTFGNNGTQIIEKKSGTSEGVFDLVQGADGSLFISSGYHSNSGLLVAKLDSNGQPDTGYGDYAPFAAYGYQPNSSLDGTATFVEGGAPVIMDSDVVIFDVDLNPDALQTTGDYDGVTLTVNRDGGADADDVFSGVDAIDANQVRLDGGNVYLAAAHVGSFTQSAGELVITFAAGTTQKQINAVASGLAYKNTSTTPPASVTIAWVASDGTTSDSGTTTVNITATDNAATASISGLPIQGQTLTAIATDPDGTTTSSFAYEWFADGNTINGATAETYTLTQAEVGKAITVQVSFNDDAGNSESPTSEPTTAVLNVNDLPSGQVRIEGVPVVEKTLTAVHDINDADMIDGSLSYQWYANGVAISGATTVTLTLAEPQLGTAVTVTISYRDQGGNNESLTSAPVVIRPAGTVIYLFSDSFE